jgi:methylated-DNA-[protein]-cysteine S-methyltransferase
MMTNHEAQARDLLETLPAVTDTQLRSLHDRLAAHAAAEGVLDVAYRTLDTPAGTLLLAATDQGLVRVAWPSEGHDQVLESLASRLSPRILNAPARLDPVARELDEYFAGRRREFDLPLDFSLSSGFRRVVLGCLTGIAYGQTASYSVVAAAAGSPRAFRAVGTACRTNPLPVVVPCHRVIHADGSIGEYLGGPEAKRMLLNLEAA